MVEHFTYALGPYRRGFHLITKEVLSAVGPLPESGLMHVFIQHTSAGLLINENADPDVLHDFELYFNKIVPENIPGMRHTLEGPDDMPAHVKAAFTGSSISIPIIGHKLALGTWQGIYLCEFRNHASPRKLIISVVR